MSATQVYDLGRALCGFLPLTTTWKNTVIKLYDVCKCDAEYNTEELGCSSTAKPGYVIYDKSKRILKVKCADGKWISIKKVGVIGKKTMSATDFNNGYIKKEVVENRFLT